MNKIKIINQIVIIIALVVFSAIPAYANVGIPMLALALPGMIISLIPIILIEALYIRRSLNVPFGQAIKVMGIANIESTFIGIPITWVIWVIVEMIVGYLGYRLADSLGLSIPDFWGFVFALTIGAAWLGPAESNLYWMVPAASLVLLIPFFYVSWRFERYRAKKMLQEYDPKDIYIATFTANLYSYSLLGLIVLVWLMISLIK